MDQLVLEAEGVSGQFWKLESYDVVNDRWLLYECFSYYCECEAVNECPAEHVWMELDYDTDLYDTVSRQRINYVAGAEYSFTSGSIEVVSLELQDSKFIEDENTFSMQIEMKGDKAVCVMPLGYVQAHYDSDFNIKQFRFLWGEPGDDEKVVLTIDADTEENATVLISLQRVVAEVPESSSVLQLGFDVTMAVKQFDEITAKVAKVPDHANMQSRVILENGEFSNLLFYKMFMSNEVAHMCMELPEEYIQIEYEDLEDLGNNYVEDD